MSIRMPIDQDRVAAFYRKWKVAEFALFGSVLRDDFGPESDVDVLVELAPNHGLGLWDWIDMIDELKEMFDRDVDLVSKNGLRNPFRRHAILKSREVVHAS